VGSAGRTGGTVGVTAERDGFWVDGGVGCGLVDGDGWGDGNGERDGDV
jgi:hypothetical protein